MVAIVIQTRYDEGTKSDEVATSVKVRNQQKLRRVTGFVYQCRSVLENTKVTTSLMT